MQHSACRSGVFSRELSFILATYNSGILGDTKIFDPLGETRHRLLQTMKYGTFYYPPTSFNAKEQSGPRKSKIGY